MNSNFYFYKYIKKILYRLFVSLKILSFLFSKAPPPIRVKKLYFFGFYKIRCHRQNGCFLHVVYYYFYRKYLEYTKLLLYYENIFDFKKKHKIELTEFYYVANKLDIEIVKSEKNFVSKRE